jgi:predicted transcriptional regulator
LTYDDEYLIIGFMTKVVNGVELANLIEEADLSISEFAVIEAKVHPQTVYNAIKGEPLKPRSFSRISKAMDRLRRTSTKSKAAG